MWITAGIPTFNAWGTRPYISPIKIVPDIMFPKSRNDNDNGTATSPIKLIGKSIGDGWKSPVMCLNFLALSPLNWINTKVINLHVFSNFKELYDNFDKISIGYKEDEIADPKDMLMYYSQEKIDKYGALAIKIKLIK